MDDDPSVPSLDQSVLEAIQQRYLAARALHGDSNALIPSDDAGRDENQDEEDVDENEWIQVVIEFKVDPAKTDMYPDWNIKRLFDAPRVCNFGAGSD